MLRIVGPILIMLMIGSLIFFLIEVFYRGPHDGRLRWVFGLFTLATVLVARISIEEGMERAALFSFALGIATLITSMTLVDFDYGALYAFEPVVLLLFILVVMWSANRLTWDCTLIDDSRDVSAIGLTELLSRKLAVSNQLPKEQTSAEVHSPQDSDVSELPNVSSNLLFLFFAGPKTKNTPGLWVLYFAMAAFPVFGIGQWFAQSNPAGGSFWVFLLFAVYLGSALGLLMMTSLLGLERYLHRRGAAMPQQISRNWLLVGTAFALAIMMFVLILPQPNLSGRLQSSIALLTSRIRGPSKAAVGKDGQFEGENAQAGKPGNRGGHASPSNQGESPNPPGNAKAVNSSDQKSKSNETSDDTKTGSQSGDKQKQSEGDSQKKAQVPSNSNQRPQNRDENQPKSDSVKRDGDQNQPDDPNKAPRQQQRDNNNRQPPNQAERRKQNRAEANQNRQAVNKPTPPNNPSMISRALESMAKLAQYLTYLIGVAIVLILAWMFRAELAKLWLELFGRRPSKEKAKSERAEPSQSAVEELPRFSSYQDPFASGQVRRWTPRQTIEYTFNALEAWARESGIGRATDETAYDFALELTGFDEAIGGEAKRLAELHGRCIFGDEKIGLSETSQLARLWKLMNSAMAQPSVDRI